MFMATHLVGFGAIARDPETTLIPGGTGTPIGNMTANGGLAASFDGSVNNAAGSSRTTGSTGNIGKDWGVSSTKTITKYVFKAPSDGSHYSGGATINYKLQGSTDNFSSSTVDLDTGSFLDSVAHVETVTTGITTTTAYRYHRVQISAAGGGINNAEVEFYEDI